MTDKKKLGGLMAGFLLGGLAGGILALLYAPKTGRHMREDIRGRTNELINEGRKKANDTWSAAREKAGSTFESANDFLNTGVDKVARKAEKIRNALKPEHNMLYDDVKQTRQNKNNRSQSTLGKETDSLGNTITSQSDTMSSQMQAYDETSALEKDAENTL